MSDPKSVEAANPEKKTSTITGPVDADATIVASETEIMCYWNDEEFDSGDRVSSEGKNYECSNGMWVEV
jgi:hypothetical protein